MIDLTQLHTALIGTVGLYPDQQGNEFTDDDHATPKVYLQDAHKLLRSDILLAMGPLLLSGSTIGEYPTEEVARLMTWYTQIEKGAVNKLALLLAGNPPALPLLDSMSLYPKEANLQGALNKTGRFLALRFKLCKRDIATRLKKIGLQLTGPVTDLPLYVFHSSDADPIATASLTSNLSGRTGWVNLPDTNLFSNQEGYYLIGYFENDLPMDVKAVGSPRTWTFSGCKSCDPIESEWVRMRTPYITIEPVYVDAVGDDRTMSWAEETEIAAQTWGINAIIEVECDVTSTLLSQSDMLLNAFLHVLACDVLEEIASSDRVNGVKAEMKTQAYVALYGQGNSKSDSGLASIKNDVLKTLKEQLSKMRPGCMPTEVRRGIRFDNVLNYK